MLFFTQLRKIWTASRFKIVVLEQDRDNPFPEKILINGMVFSSNLYYKIYNYCLSMKVDGVHLFVISVSGVIADLRRCGNSWRVCAVAFPSSWTEEQAYNFGRICIPTKHCYIPMKK